MILKVIFGQRHEKYKGQCGPEALDIMDEYGYAENPEWFDKELAKHESNPVFKIVKAVDIEIYDDLIDNILDPEPPKLKGEIK